MFCFGANKSGTLVIFSLLFCLVIREIISINNISHSFLTGFPLLVFLLQISEMEPNSDLQTTLNESSNSHDESEELMDYSGPIDTSLADISKSDMETSLISDEDSTKELAPAQKKIKLATDKKLLQVERERLKKEREILRQQREQAKLEKEKEKIEKEKEKIERERERIEREKLKLKQKEEREAEKEKKQLELQIKKDKQEKEKSEKLKQKEEERERKEREKKEKESERNRIREEKEKEKQRKQEEKLANEERKKQQDELEEKKLQMSRNVLFNFLKKPKPQTDSDFNGSLSSIKTNEVESQTTVTPACLLDTFDPDAFEQEIANQNTERDSLYLSQLLSGKIDNYIAQPKANANGNCDIIEVFGEENEKFIFIQFYENIRPAYFGKKLHTPVRLTGQDPFMKEEYLDYEVDSDEEWDEGGPGESLSGSDSEHEEKDDYEIDDEFFVPHGYLSDDENDVGQMDDSDVGLNHSGPLLKENALMTERDRKFAKFLVPHVIGCVWHENRDAFEDKFEFLQQFKAVLLPSLPKIVSQN